MAMKKRNTTGAKLSNISGLYGISNQCSVGIPIRGTEICGKICG